MKTFLLPIIVMFASVFATAQHGVLSTEYTTVTEAQAVSQWLDNLYEVGVMAANDTFTITEEAKRVALDSAMRSVIYLPTYNWRDAQYLLENMQIKIGLWHLINLYHDNDANQEAVLKYVIGLSGLFDMKKALMASFYTYIFFDPEACEIVNGKPVIHRPDILDQKLEAVRRITAHLVAN